jgi:hypothetical protein
VKTANPVASTKRRILSGSVIYLAGCDPVQTKKLNGF